MKTTMITGTWPRRGLEDLLNSFPDGESGVKRDHILQAGRKDCFALPSASSRRQQPGSRWSRGAGRARGQPQASRSGGPPWRKSGNRVQSWPRPRAAPATHRIRTEHNLFELLRRFQPPLRLDGIGELLAGRRRLAADLAAGFTVFCCWIASMISGIVIRALPVGRFHHMRMAYGLLRTRSHWQCPARA